MSLGLKAQTPAPGIPLGLLPTNTWLLLLEVAEELLVTGLVQVRQPVLAGLTGCFGPLVRIAVSHGRTVH